MKTSTNDHREPARRRTPSPLGPSIVRIAAILALTATLAARVARADYTLIDFENNPKHAVGPSTFNPAANSETLTATNNGGGTIATISGGVVLGNPTFVASFPGANGSAPNAYGTAFFAPNLSSTLTITFDPSVKTTEVTGAVFNGRGDVADYEVFGFMNGGGTASDYLANLPVNLDPASSAKWDIQATAGSFFTSVQIVEMMPGDGAYDFLIDNVGMTYTIPEPSTLTLCAIGAAIALAHASARARSRRGRA